MKRKIILFGGTFDPIHKGHTTVAASAAKQIGAEEVLFIPVRRSPHKKIFPCASTGDRAKMVALAITGTKNFSLSRCELDRDEPSYTLDTVRQLKAQYGPGAEIYWLVGADALDELQEWYRIKDLIDECVLSVMFRAGPPKPDFERFIPIFGKNRVKKLQRNVIETPLIDISSTEIRQRLAGGDDVADMLHPAVWAYIRQKHLYQSNSY